MNKELMKEMMPLTEVLVKHCLIGKSCTAVNNAFLDVTQRYGNKHYDLYKEMFFADNGVEFEKQEAKVLDRYLRRYVK